MADPQEDSSEPMLKFQAAMLEWVSADEKFQSSMAKLESLVDSRRSQPTDDAVLDELKGTLADVRGELSALVKRLDKVKAKKEEIQNYRDNNELVKKILEMVDGLGLEHKQTGYQQMVDRIDEMRREMKLIDDDDANWWKKGGRH